MVTWPSSKSPHMCHGTNAKWESWFDNSSTEGTLNLEALRCFTSGGIDKGTYTYFSPFFLRSPAEITAIMWPSHVLLFPFTTRSACYEVFFLNVFELCESYFCTRSHHAWKHTPFRIWQFFFTGVLNWIQLNDSRIGLSSVLIISKIYI